MGTLMYVFVPPLEKFLPKNHSVFTLNIYSKFYFSLSHFAFTFTLTLTVYSFVAFINRSLISLNLTFASSNLSLQLVPCLLANIGCLSTGLSIGYYTVFLSWSVTVGVQNLKLAKISMFSPI